MTTLHGIEVKVGDAVWDCLFGWDEVIAIDEKSICKIITHQTTYSETGRYLEGNKNPRLFWQEFGIPAHAFEKPKAMVKKYQVLYKYENLYFTSANIMRNLLYSGKEAFDKLNAGKNYKFISLIIESEIEVEE